jgi:hypothetical protein
MTTSVSKIGVPPNANSKMRTKICPAHTARIRIACALGNGPRTIGTTGYVWIRAWRATPTGVQAESSNGKEVQPARTRPRPGRLVVEPSQ